MGNIDLVKVRYTWSTVCICPFLKLFSSFVKVCSLCYKFLEGRGPGFSFKDQLVEKEDWGKEGGGQSLPSWLTAEDAGVQNVAYSYGQRAFPRLASGVLLAPSAG